MEKKYGNDTPVDLRMEAKAAPEAKFYENDMQVYAHILLDFIVQGELALTLRLKI